MIHLRIPVNDILLIQYHNLLSFEAELGDYNPEDHTEGYLSEFRFIPNQTEQFEREVAELHQQHRYVVGDNCCHKVLNLK